MNPALLDADLGASARQLIATGRLRAESDPEQYQAAVKGHEDLAEFFRTELGWTMELHEVASLVRLHKRRSDVPAGRGPLLVRDRHSQAPTLVMILACLACEQLWRRPRMSLRELVQAIAQVCAAEANNGRLPRFPVVASHDVSKKEARANRLSLADALKLLVEEGTISVDADLDRALADEDGDLVVSASRDRLAAKFSSLSPTLLELGGLPPEEHAAALSAESLMDHTSEALDTAPTVEQRRLKAIRRLIDDPVTDPLDDDADTTAYLHSLTGRERALNVVAALGLSATVRRDCWQITDPTGQASAVDFPNGRRMERQAALALLAALPDRDDPAAPLPLAEASDLFTRVRADLPRWAASYDRMPALARAAAAELVSVGLLAPDPENPDQWQPTPGVHLWRVRVHQPAPATEARANPAATTPAPLSEQKPLPEPNSGLDPLPSPRQGDEG
ncbi:DUF2398 family protein [Streptomyces sp. NPDC097617]|uniref:DUF2398 family protein n=1 Tax=Streptomyces sp. NPDC097617 TaxID=3366091 RepID=UPI0037FBB340